MKRERREAVRKRGAELKARLEAEPAPSCLQSVQSIQDDPHYEDRAIDDPFRLAPIIRERVGPLVCWQDCWWQYEGGAYRQVSAAFLKSLVAAEAQREFNESGHQTRDDKPASVTPALVTRTLLALAALTTEDKSLEAPYWIGKYGPAEGPYLVFRNGLLNVDRALAGETDHCRAHTPAWFSQVQIDYDYIPLPLSNIDFREVCPDWLAFLYEALEGDSRRIAMVQELFGYCLEPGNRLQKFFLVTGQAGSGKSTVLEILRALLGGAANCTSVPLSDLGSQFSGYSAAFALANIAGEVDPGKTVHEALIKAWVGGDYVKVEQKYEPVMSVRPLSKLIFSMNEPPPFADRTEGIWRRLVPMPFNWVVREHKAEDRDLGERLRGNELSGILLWSMAGLRRLRKRGAFTRSEVIEQAVEEHKLESQPERRFLLEHCQYREDLPARDSVPCEKLYQEYQNWCARAGVKKLLEDTRFGKQVRAVFPGVERARPRTSDGSRVWVYEGLTLSSRAVLGRS